MNTPTLSRRAMLGASVATAAISEGAALPALSKAASSDEGAGFLEWERHADFWWNAPAGITDDEMDARMDRYDEFAGLIFRTESTGLVAAQVKARALHRLMEDMDKEHAPAMACIIEALGAAAASSTPVVR
jgi:uncharacterized membrane-anchored protein